MLSCAAEELFSMSRAALLQALHSRLGVSKIRITRMADIGCYALTSFTWGCYSDSKIRVSNADLSLRLHPLLLQRQQRGVAAGGRRIDREGALGGEAVEVAGPAGLRAGAGEALAAEGLHADARAV